jgi:uncharacterized protein YbjQ (UPF0145 family)
MEYCGIDLPTTQTAKRNDCLARATSQGANIGMASHQTLASVIARSKDLERRFVMDERMTTTAFEIPGTRIAQNHGVVRGITVRSRSVLGTLGASLQTIVGGNITLFTELCEKTREEAFESMLRHAAELGANAVIGVRYDATEVMSGVSEVLCYGTAVTIARDSD